ncbi:MAG: peroxiredoxin family protein [Pyrinomonadaceae bacterium]
MLSSLKHNFDTSINITVLVCLVALIGFFGYRWFVPQTRQSNYKEDFAEGKTLAEVPNLDEGNYEKSIILILNTDCKYCNASVDFYKRLANTKYDTNSKQLVALFLQPKEIVDKYISEKAFPIRSISSVSFEKLKAGVTPTIVAIDKQRRIIRAWFGKLPPDKEQEVLDVLEK